jgi:hypothetical protein
MKAEVQKKYSICIAIEKEEQYLPIILERGQLNTCTLSNFEEVV